MQIIRWGIIGCGDVTEVKSGPGFQKANNSSLVAVMRRNGELAKDYAHRHGVPKWYDDAAALIHDPEVDAVYVATPPSSHKDYTLACAQAGKPVFVEKPMALNFEECQAMLAACRAAEVPLFVAYYRRTLPRFLKIKELLEAGVIGQVRFVTMTLYLPFRPDTSGSDNLPWRVQPQIAGGGLFVDLGSHMLDFLDDALGPIRTVEGFASNQARRYPAEDIVTGAFMFESGVHGAGAWCFSGYDQVDRTEIVGTQGKIAFATFEPKPIEVTTQAGVSNYAIGDPPHVHQPLIQTIVDTLNGAGACPSTGDSAARTSWVMDQLLRGYNNAASLERV
jgi:predicted dehydrogenase